jgi:hypothetical protein
VWARQLRGFSRIEGEVGSASVLHLQVPCRTADEVSANVVSEFLNPEACLMPRSVVVTDTGIKQLHFGPLDTVAVFARQRPLYV